MQGKKTKTAAFTLFVVAGVQFCSAMGWIPHIPEDVIRSLADGAIALGLFGLWSKVDQTQEECKE